MQYSRPLGGLLSPDVALPTAPSVAAVQASPDTSGSVPGELSSTSPSATASSTGLASTDASNAPSADGAAS